MYYLQCELERERMALELEEEKRAQAEQEKRLQEQAKKIENLSSMVFCANREEAGGFYKKVFLSFTIFYILCCLQDVLQYHL